MKQTNAALLKRMNALCLLTGFLLLGYSPSYGSESPRLAVRQKSAEPLRFKTGMIGKDNAAGWSVENNDGDWDHYREFAVSPRKIKIELYKHRDWGTSIKECRVVCNGKLGILHWGYLTGNGVPTVLEYATVFNMKTGKVLDQIGLCSYSAAEKPTVKDFFFSIDGNGSVTFWMPRTIRQKDDDFLKEFRDLPEN